MKLHWLTMRSGLLKGVTIVLLVLRLMEKMKSIPLLSARGGGGYIKSPLSANIPRGGILKLGGVY